MTRQTRSQAYGDIGASEKSEDGARSRRNGKFGVDGLKSKHANRAARAIKNGQHGTRQRSKASAQHEAPTLRDNESLEDIDANIDEPVPKRRKIIEGSAVEGQQSLESGKRRPIPHASTECCAAV